MTIPLRTLLDFALDAAWQAGRITLAHFQTGIAVERKSDSSPVTIADKSAEQKLRELITQYWPTHSIIGEEFGQSPKSDSPYTWILDPIDGTKSFVAGVPLYGTLVALVENDQPLVGVAHFPALNETVYAARGEGSFWNGRRTQVSKVSDLKDAVLLVSEPYTRNAEQYAAWNRLADATYIRRTWADAYGYALVATGRAEICLDYKMQVWDNAPFPVIMEEAGGTFTDWQGTSTIHAKATVGTNGHLATAVYSLLNNK